MFIDYYFFVSFSSQSNSVRSQVYEHKLELAERQCEISTLSEALAEKTKANEQFCKSIQYMMIRIKSLESDLKRMRGEKNETNNSTLEEVRIGCCGAKVKCVYFVSCVL